MSGYKVVEIKVTRKDRELKLLATDKLLLRHMRSLEKRYGGSFYRKHADMAQAIGVHVRTVIRSIIRLFKAGLIGTKNRWRDMAGGGKWFGASWYWVTKSLPTDTFTLSDRVPEQKVSPPIINDNSSKKDLKSEPEVVTRLAWKLPVGISEASQRAFEDFARRKDEREAGEYLRGFQ